MDFDNLDLDSNYQDDLFEEELKLMTKENMVDYSSLKDSVVFLVDALSENYHEVFRIAENFLKTKVISNEND